MVTSPDGHEIHTYIGISREHLIFQTVLHGPGSRRNCSCVDSKFSGLFKDILYQTNSYKFLMSIHNLGFLHFGSLSSSAMERCEDGRQRMLGSLPWIDSQFVGLCAEL